MAIIRSKIARQLLAEGGAPRKGYFDAGRVGDPNTGNLAGSLNEAAGLGNTGQEDIDSGYTGGDFNVTPRGPSITDRINTGIDNTRDALTRRAINRNMMSTRDAILSLNPFGPRTDMNLFDVYQQMNTQGGLFAEGLTGTKLDMDRAKSTFDKLEKEGIDITKDIGPQLDNLTQSQINNILNINRPTQVSDSAPVLPKLPRIAKVPSDVEQQKSDLGEFIASIRGANPTAFNIPERFRLAEGGEPRQEYGLGSIVKKVTGAVKKVAKSDLGKAALIGAAAFGVPGTQFGGLFGRASFGGAATGLLGKQGLSAFAFPEFLSTATDVIPGGGVTASIVGASLLGGLLTSKQPEQDINALSQRISDQTGIDVSKIRGEVQQAYQNKDTSTLAQKYPFLVNQEYSASFAKGGRTGFAEGTPKDEVIEERGLPTLKTMPEFKGDEVKPADMMMASAVGDESDDIAMQLFGKPVKDLNPDEFKELQDEIDRLMNKFRSQKSRKGIMMASNIENERILENLFEKYLDMGLSPKDAEKAAFDEFERMSRKQSMDRTMAAEGGMMNLGGNEMDLRGGGFVPIGAREKADDVPARLSKNEFVFTADAVRAAGGGSVDRGADLMYKTMKQLENKVV